MSNTIPWGDHPRSMVMRVNKSKVLSAPERKDRCSQHACQRETGAPQNRTRTVLEGDCVLSLGHRYTSQGEIHFVDLGRLAVHAGVPTWIVSVGEYHHPITAHVRADGDLRGSIPSHQHGVFCRGASLKLGRRTFQGQRLPSQFVPVILDECPALVGTSNGDDL